MSQEHDRETIESLTRLALELEKRESDRLREVKEAYVRHVQATAVIAGTLFVVGGLVVILITGRPYLLILVGVVCVVGYAVNMIGDHASLASRRQ